MAANVPIYFNQGGAELVIGSGGTLTAAAGSTINFDAGTVDIADNSITTDMLQNDAVTTAKIAPLNVTDAELAANSVITAKILDDNVTTAKIAPLNVTDAELAANSVITSKILDDNVTTAKIAPLNVTDAELAANSVTTAKITDLNVTTGKIANQGVTFAKALVFISTEQTGNGMAQPVAHMLGVNVTGKVLVVPTSNVGLMDGEFDIAWTADATDVTVTATSGLQYYVYAWG